MRKSDLVQRNEVTFLDQMRTRPAEGPDALGAADDKTEPIVFEEEKGLTTIKEEDGPLHHVAPLERRTTSGTDGLGVKFGPRAFGAEMHFLKFLSDF